MAICEQAREHLTTATAMYREMDMMLWLLEQGTSLSDQFLFTGIGWLAREEKSSLKGSAHGGV